MTDEQKQEAEVHNHAIPSSFTLPILANSLRDTLKEIGSKLIGHGTPEETVRRAFSEADLTGAVKKANNLILTAVSDYLYRKELEAMRIDYLGRALIFDIEKFFPRNPETARRLLSEPVAGHLPIQIAEGVIAALKAAHGVEVISEYEGTAAKKAEQYRGGEDHLIDADKFVQDPDVKRLATDIITRFRLLLHKKPEADRKKWMLNQIQKTESFKEMKRELTDEELSAITRVFLKIG